LSSTDEYYIIILIRSAARVPVSYMYSTSVIVKSPCRCVLDIQVAIISLA